MTNVTIRHGVCGFETNVKASSEDKQNVKITLDSTCPNIQKADLENFTIDIFVEIGKKLDGTEVYKKLSVYIPHNTCSIFTGILKAVEVETGMALPKDASIKFD